MPPISMVFGAQAYNQLTINYSVLKVTYLRTMCHKMTGQKQHIDIVKNERFIGFYIKKVHELSQHWPDDPSKYVEVMAVD